MSITSLTIERINGLSVATAVSDLIDPLFYWYLDGVYLTSTVAGRYSIYIAPGDQARLEVLDSTDPAFDPIANTPESYPARFLLSWSRSPDADVDRYKVRRLKGLGPAVDVATIRAVANRWTYEYRTDRLEDLATYAFSVIPVDKAGNEGDALEIMDERIVRRPDAPRFDLEFNAGPTTVTITELT